MGKFSHLKAFDVNEATTAEYELTEIDGNIILVVAPANNSNSGYFGDLVKSAGKLVPTGKRRRTMASDPKIMDKIRGVDRALYPKHVIKGWKNVMDAKGVEVPFNEADAVEFLGELPDWIFDNLREFCSNAHNFANLDEDAAGN